MQPDKETIRQLMAKHLEGSSSPEEDQLLWQWIAQLNVQDQPLFSGSAQEKATKDRIHGAVLARIYRRPRIGQYLRVAAAVLLLALPAALFYHFSRGKDRNPPMATVFVNDGNRIRTILLPDSSLVTLNGFSRIDWQEKDGQRLIHLSGEAYFEVHPDPAHPFRVYADSLLTEALGTSFNIEAYRKEGEIRVSLVSGKVRTGNAQGPVLTPGQMARYTRSNGALQVQPVPVEDITAWKKGGMSFANIPLTEALDRIAARYNLEIRYDPDLLRGKRVTAVFYQAGWQAVLSNILFLPNLHYTIKNNRVQIY